MARLRAPGLVLALCLGLDARAEAPPESEKIRDVLDRVPAVTDLRIGLHSGFTRVVVETDRPAVGTLERTAPGRLDLWLGASGRSRSLAALGPLLEKVFLVSEDPASCTLRLHLRVPEVSVDESRLRDPPRIVLDLRPAAPP